MSWTVRGQCDRSRCCASNGQTVLVTQIAVTRSLAIHPSEWLTTIKRLIGM